MRWLTEEVMRDLGVPPAGGVEAPRPPVAALREAGGVKAALLRGLRKV
jgi:hypothetical protein